MRTGVIYKADINDKSYIGYSIDFHSRQKDHLRARDNCIFHFAILKYGAENVEWTILEDNIPEHRLSDREVLWIAFYDTFYNGYNMTEGGEVLPKVSDETKAKISLTQRKKIALGIHHNQDPEVRKRMSEGHQKNIAAGKHPSQQKEWQEKVSNTMKEKAARGEHHTQRVSVRNNMSEAQKAYNANRNLSDQKEAGQIFIFEVEEIEKTKGS